MWRRWAVTQQWYHPQLPLTEQWSKTQRNISERIKANPDGVVVIATDALRREAWRALLHLRLTLLQNSVRDRKVKQQKGSLAKAKCKLTFEMSPAGNSIKILQTRAESEKSHNVKSGLKKWKKNYCIWQCGEGTRAQGNIFKWAIKDWKIFAWLSFNMDVSWYAHLLAFTNEVSLSPEESLLMLAMTEWKMWGRN